MAAYTSTTSGNFSAGATWVGGIAPSTVADSVTIANGHTVTTDTNLTIGKTTINTGGTLVIASTMEMGDDSTTAITVNGTLKASRSTSNQLTCVGQLVTGAASTAVIDYGTSADPIPSGVTATLILNKSSAMSDFKYGMFIANTSKAWFYGATRAVNTTTTSALAASGTSVDVADITGWNVGDIIVFPATDGTLNHFDDTTISTITPGTGTTGTITFPAVTYAHASGCSIGNFSSNVTVKNYNTTNTTFACFFSNSTSSNSFREVQYTSFQYVGSNTSLPTTQVFVCNATVVMNPFIALANNSFYKCNKTQGQFFYQFQTDTVMTNCAFFGGSGLSGILVYLAAGTSMGLTNCVFYGSSGVLLQSAFSEGSNGSVITGCKFWSAGTTSGTVNINPGAGLVFNSCQWHSSPGNALINLASGSASFNNCQFGDATLPGSPTFGYIFDAGAQAAHYFSALFTDCLFGTPTTSTYTRFTGANGGNAGSKIIFSNKNVDPLVQEIYTPLGSFYRDNSTYRSGTASMRCDLVTTGSTYATNTWQIFAPSGQPVVVSGYLRKNSNYGSSTRPYVTLSGLGITESTYTMTDVSDTWEQFIVSGTQTTGTDGVLTLTWGCKSTNASSSAWIDGIVAPPAEAVNSGELEYWADGQPAKLIAANYTSANDVWNALTTNITLTGSIGVFIKRLKGVLKIN